MADRAIVKYQEPEDDGGYKLEIQRSASGLPIVLITVTPELAPDQYGYTVVVHDAPKVLAPLVAWLKEKENA